MLQCQYFSRKRSTSSQSQQAASTNMTRLPPHFRTAGISVHTQGSEKLSWGNYFMGWRASEEYKKKKKNIQSISFWLRRRGSFNSACHFLFFLWRLSFKSCHRRPSCQLPTPALAGLTSSRAENFNSPLEGASTKISGGCILPAAVVEITKRARQKWRREKKKRKDKWRKKKTGVKV